MGGCTALGIFSAARHFGAGHLTRKFVTGSVTETQKWWIITGILRMKIAGARWNQSNSLTRTAARRGRMGKGCFFREVPATDMVCEGVILVGPGAGGRKKPVGAFATGLPFCPNRCPSRWDKREPHLQVLIFTRLTNGSLGQTEREGFCSALAVICCQC